MDLDVVFRTDVIEQGSKADLTFQPTFSQFEPTVPNSRRVGLSQQCDCATPIAAILVSTNEKMMSPGDSSRIVS
jgi:hypothetical protein